MSERKSTPFICLRWVAQELLIQETLSDCERLFVRRHVACEDPPAHLPLGVVGLGLVEEVEDRAGREALVVAVEDNGIASSTCE
mgnify:CR=1 FL=1